MLRSTFRVCAGANGLKEMLTNYIYISGEKDKGKRKGEREGKSRKNERENHGRMRGKIKEE